MGLLLPTSGDIAFEGKSLSECLRRHAAGFRKKVQMIFQNPYLSLDPKWQIRAIVEEGIRDLPRSERLTRCREVLDQVGLPAGCLKRKPHELSGGERQRVALARALAVRPAFLVLDEPTSQLDVSIQAKIAALLKELRRFFEGGMLFISHDLALVSTLAEEVIVLHQGKVVEQGPKAAVLKAPRHEVTQQLIRSIPKWTRT